jgi:hypothetical protein
VARLVEAVKEDYLVVEISEVLGCPAIEAGCMGVVKQGNLYLGGILVRSDFVRVLCIGEEGGPE